MLCSHESFEENDCCRCRTTKHTRSQQMAFCLRHPCYPCACKTCPHRFTRPLCPHPPNPLGLLRSRHLLPPNHTKCLACRERIVNGGEVCAAGCGCCSCPRIIPDHAGVQSAGSLNNSLQGLSIAGNRGGGKLTPSKEARSVRHDNTPFNVQSRRTCFFQHVCPCPCRGPCIFHHACSESVHHLSPQTPPLGPGLWGLLRSSLLRSPTARTPCMPSRLSVERA